MSSGEKYTENIMSNILIKSVFIQHTIWLCKKSWKDLFKRKMLLKFNVCICIVLVHYIPLTRIKNLQNAIIILLKCNLFNVCFYNIFYKYGHLDVMIAMLIINCVHFEHIIWLYEYMYNCICNCTMLRFVGCQNRE